METDIQESSDSQVKSTALSIQFKFRELRCHLCQAPFPSNHSFFIKIDKASQVEDGKVVPAIYTGIETEDLVCVPCINRRAGIDPEERNKAKRAQFGLTPNIKLIPVKIVKPKTKSNNNQQPSLF